MGLTDPQHHNLGQIRFPPLDPRRTKRVLESMNSFFVVSGTKMTLLVESVEEVS